MNLSLSWVPSAAPGGAALDVHGFYPSVGTINNRAHSTYRPGSDLVLPGKAVGFFG
ncbi:hypothetical protein N9444_01250 [Gammaproteobacteria bacterium]|nr:hypothetical protein [Gammaproteobacteria bacterium]